MKKLFYLFTTTALLMAVFTTCNKSVTGVKLNETSLTLEIGETKTLVATVLPENTKNQEVVWTSNNFAVATVTPTGIIKALSEGTATITATTVDGNFKADCTVHVTAIPREKLLTQSKGWQLTAGTIYPPIDLMSGGYVSDLFDGFLYDCELDDVIYFKPTNKAQILKYGDDLCDGQTGEEEMLGRWNLYNSDQSLSFYFLDFGMLSHAAIITLNATTLELVFQEELYVKKTANNSRWNSSAKARYVFTVTYTKTL